MHKLNENLYCVSWIDSLPNISLFFGLVQALRALLSVLDDRGRREARLIESLEKRESFLCQAMLRRIDHVVREDSSSSPVSDIDNNNLCLNEIANDQQAAIVFEKRGNSLLWSLVQEFDEWIWDKYYLNLNVVKHSRRSYLDSLTRCKSCHDLYWRDEKHCKICHATFELDIDLEERYAIHEATCSRKNEESSDSFPDHKVRSSQLQSLKAAVYAIEVCRDSRFCFTIFNLFRLSWFVLRNCSLSWLTFFSLQCPKMP